MFSRDEYRARLHTLCAALESDGIDLLWMTSPEAIAWLHGLTLSWYKANGPMRYPQCYGAAIHVASRRFMHFDYPTERPLIEEFSVSPDNRWLPNRDAAPNLQFIMTELKSEGWLKGRVAIELWSYLPNPAISSMFRGAFRASGCDVIDASAIVRKVRNCKSPAELHYVERAMEICDVGHRAVRELYRPGITELELFGAVTAAMSEKGGELPALLPIFCGVRVVGDRPVAFGHRAAMRRPIEAGHVLVADLCGVYHRYHANAMRGFYVGDDPPAKLVERYRVSGAAYTRLAEQCRAGMSVGEVIAVMRRYYEEAGIWDPQEGWAIGYELGLSLPPDWVGDFYFNLGDEKGLERRFEPGMVTNFESIFDTALIDTIIWESAGARVLSKTPRELMILA
jgi:Xaa-Pro aminopeptidase